MNKKYLLISALVFSFGLHAEKIQSIENYLTLHASDNQEAVSSYLSKRCAATFLVVAKIFNNENKPDDKKVSDTMTKAAVKMIETASYIDASVAKRDVLDVAGAPAHVDFLSLDVEGAEFEILETFPFDRRSFGLLVVEHAYVKEKQDKILKLLEGAGYVR